MKMNIVKFLVISALICSFNVIASAVSLDAVKLNEDYESYNIGYAPISSSAGITLVGFDDAVGLTAEVTEDSKSNKALCMKYTYMEESDSPVGTIVVGTHFTSQDSTMSFKLMTENAESYVNIGFRVSSSAKIWPLVISEGQFKSSSSEYTACTPGKWYQVDMNYQRQTDILTISIDGVKFSVVKDVSSHLNMTDTNTTMRIQMMNSEKMNNAVWVDDFVFTESNGYINEPKCFDENMNEVTALKSGLIRFESDAVNNSNDELPLLMLVRASKDDKVVYIGWTEVTIHSGKEGQIGAEITIPEDYSGYDVECILIESFDKQRPVCRGLKLK